MEKWKKKYLIKKYKKMTILSLNEELEGLKAKQKLYEKYKLIPEIVIFLHMCNEEIELLEDYILKLKNLLSNIQKFTF